MSKLWKDRVNEWLKVSCDYRIMLFCKYHDNQYSKQYPKLPKVWGWFGWKKGLKVSKAALLGSIIIKYTDKNNGATARNRLDLIGGSVISPKNGTCSRNWNFRTAWNIRWQYWIAIINQSTNQIRGSILADFGLFLVGLWVKNDWRASDKIFKI